jgi:hypothetical protein
VDLAWIAPPAVLLAGAAGAAVLARRLVVAASELAVAQRRLRRLEDAVIPVRVETRRARASIDRLDRR